MDLNLLVQKVSLALSEGSPSLRLFEERGALTTVYCSCPLTFSETTALAKSFDEIVPPKHKSEHDRKSNKQNKSKIAKSKAVSSYERHIIYNLKKTINSQTTFYTFRNIYTPLKSTFLLYENVIPTKRKHLKIYFKNSNSDSRLDSAPKHDPSRNNQMNDRSTNYKKLKKCMLSMHVQKTINDLNIIEEAVTTDFKASCGWYTEKTIHEKDINIRVGLVQDYQNRFNLDICITSKPNLSSEALFSVLIKVLQNIFEDDFEIEVENVS